MKKYLFIVLAAALTFTACSKKPVDQKTSEPTNQEASAQEIPAQEQQAPLENPYMDFTGYTPDGDAIALSSIVGQTDYVLVDFWASWCGPCRRLIPVLKDMYGRMPAGRLQIVSCSVDQEEAAWLQALQAEQMPWIQMHDDENFTGATLYNVEFIPHTILIDRRGEIVGVNLEEPEIEEILMK